MPSPCTTPTVSLSSLESMAREIESLQAATDRAISQGASDDTIDSMLEEIARKSAACVDAWRVQLGR